MNVYSVLCLETGDYDTLFTNNEKAVSYLFRTYADDVDFSNYTRFETSRKLKKTGYVEFPLKEYEGEIVKITKVKVY